MRGKLPSWIVILSVAGAYFALTPDIIGDFLHPLVRLSGWVDLHDREGCVVWGVPDASSRYTWSGDCEAGKAHGEGFLNVTVFKKDTWLHSRLEGRLEKGKFEGLVRVNTSNGAFYEGEYKDGLKNGRGVQNFPNGGRYEGEYRNGMRHGQGTLHSVESHRYQGGWRYDKEHGEAVMVWGDGDRYEGEYRDGRVDGRGTVYFADGNRYEGDFENEYMHGRGTYTWGYGKWGGYQWRGSFLDSQPHGKGMLIAPDAEEFELNAHEGTWINCSVARSCPPLPL